MDLEPTAAAMDLMAVACSAAPWEQRHRWSYRRWASQSRG